MGKYDTTRWGTIMIATTHAVEQGLAKAGQRGILIGINSGYSPWIKIVKEGNTCSEIYHESFWEEPTDD